MKIFLCDLIHDFGIAEGSVGGRDDFMTTFVVPLNIANIAAYAHQEFPGELDIELFKYPKQLLDALDAAEPAILGLSNYTWNTDINQRVIAYAKKRHPNLLVVMGGPAIRTDRKGIEGFLKERHKIDIIDIYVMFQGEWPFVEIVKAFKSFGRDFLRQDHQLPNCAYLLDGNLVYHQDSSTRNLEDLPSPYLNGLLDPFLEKGIMPLFETNRGCPFRCTYCAWGVAALNKVRKFPMERIVDELEYVSSRFPKQHAWTFADANFGMLKRDVDIARKIGEIRKRTPALNKVLTFEAKNSTSRVLETNRLIGADAGEIVLAVQTLDPTAQAAVKRDNIKFDDISGLINEFHDGGARIETHVLAPLPEETYDAQIETLRKCFNLGIDSIYILTPLLLPGTEMENEETRSKYGLRTKFQTRQDNYGEYNGIKSIECEELVIGTNAVSDSEIDRLRAIHWLVWYGWTYEFLKPILLCAHETGGLNPIDVILRAVKGNPLHHGLIDQFLKDFRRDYENNLFENENDLKEFYLSENNWAHILNNGFSRAAYLYNSIMTLSQDIFRDLVELIVEIIEQDAPSATAAMARDVAQVVLESRFHPEDLLAGKIDAEKRLLVRGDILPYFEPRAGCSDYPATTEDVEIILRKPLEEQQHTISELRRLGGDEDLRIAVERVMRDTRKSFVYHIDPEPAQVSDGTRLYQGNEAADSLVANAV